MTVPHSEKYLKEKLCKELEANYVVSSSSIHVKLIAHNLKHFVRKSETTHG